MVDLAQARTESVAAADGPDKITIVYASIADPVAMPDPIGDPASRYIDATKSRYIDDTALRSLGSAATAGQPAAVDSATKTVPITLKLEGETQTVLVAARDIGDSFLALYAVGGWPWVVGFLSSIIEKTKPGAIPAGVQQAFSQAVSDGLATLNTRISDVLVQFAERALILGRERATEALKNLIEEEQTYAIHRQNEQTSGSGGAGDTSSAQGGGGQGASGQSGAGGGASSGQGGGTGQGTSSSQSGTEGGAGDSRSPYVASARGASLSAKVSAAVTAWTEYRKYFNPPDFVDPNVPTVPAALVAQYVADARKDFLAKLREAGNEHRLAPGVIGKCLPTDKFVTSVELSDNDVFSATVDYIAAAKDTLQSMLTEEPYPSAFLREQLKGSIGPAIWPLGLHPDDTPEVRASIWAGYTRQRIRMEPLRADALLRDVLSDIVDAARAEQSVDALFRAQFAGAVLASYQSETDVRFAIQATTLQQAEAPFASLDSVVAALDLIAIFLLPPLAPLAGVVTTFVGGLSIYSLYGHAVNQFEEAAVRNTMLDDQSAAALFRELNGRALDALLDDPEASFAQLVAQKRYRSDVLVDVAKSVATVAGIGKVLPPLALALNTANDTETLLRAAGALPDK